MRLGDIVEVLVGRCCAGESGGVRRLSRYSYSVVVVVAGVNTYM